ncbi:MAG: pectinacetylesterase family protein [Clostridiales bacterium]|jgi:hypothetical protein|nr:pectinacetylesterase family protein [Clostridiales bacterium]
MKILKSALLLVFVPLLLGYLTLKTLFKSKRYRGDMREGQWYELRPKGLRNSMVRGSPFYARKGSNKKLIVYFCGGGMSWSEESAARPMSILRTALGSAAYYTGKVYGFMRVFFTGILARKPQNPFKDWNVVYIPYVTGDFYLGNNAFPYKSLAGRRKTLYHIGESNTRVIMDGCKKLFPEAEALFVCGDSAGAFGAAGNAPLVAEYYPNLPVTVYSDASQITVPIWRGIAGGVWRVNPEILEKIDDSGDLYYNLISYSHAKMGGRAVFLRSNTIYDDIISRFTNKLRGGGLEATPESTAYCYESLKASEERLAASGLPYYSFVTAHNKNPKTGLTQHTMMRSETAYYYKDDVGIALCQWLINAVNGKRETLSTR